LTISYVISHNQEDIIDRILKSGAGLTRSDIVSVPEAARLPPGFSTCSPVRRIPLTISAAASRYI
jgi:hypothetical protein